MRSYVHGTKRKYKSTKIVRVKQKLRNHSTKCLKNAITKYSSQESCKT